EEVSNQHRVPYLFTAKELDRETGLYYFGARYYDARTSVWQSPDPILGDYLPSGDKEKDKKLPGSGGVFNSPNLGLYTYVRNNPVLFIDAWGLYWEYEQITGDLYYVDNEKTTESKRVLIAKGYSGNGLGRDNPLRDNVKNSGPIPAGVWKIGKPRNSKKTGKHVMDLTPMEGTETHGRSGFQIHGDNKKQDNSASSGCVILNKAIREKISGSGDNELKVVPGELKIDLKLDRELQRTSV
ncbi:MAG: DUF2778 domain-containing protein, partial [Candidatus Electrothrix sp. ATG2]|nr:DUF2778 domain-containing protein [Candidatus Electrothrix sp. ATG2]